MRRRGFLGLVGAALAAPMMIAQLVLSPEFKPLSYKPPSGVFTWSGKHSSEGSDPRNWLEGVAPAGNVGTLVIPVGSCDLGKCGDDLVVEKLWHLGSGTVTIGR